jgi:hypothetical protein
METPPREIRGSTVPPPERVRIRNRETDLPGPTLLAGVLALSLGSFVWIYAGWLWIHPEVVTHGQRYLMFVLSAVSDIGLAPAALAILLGLAGLFRRHVRTVWRLRLVLGMTLGATQIGLTLLRYWLASRGGFG